MKFFFPQSNREALLQIIDDGIKSHGLSDYVAITHVDDLLVLRVQKCGNTEVTIRMTPKTDGVEVCVVDQKISFFHKAAFGDISRRLSDIVRSQGGMEI